MNKILFFSLIIYHSLSYADVKFHVYQDDDNSPVENTVIELINPPSSSLHDTRARSKSSDNIMDQVQRQFLPEVLIIQKGTSVKFPNNDKIRHQVYSFSKAKRFELPLYGKKIAPPVEFEKVGIVVLGCNIHDWMKGYIYIANNHWVGKTDQNGFLYMNNLSEGQYQFKVWHSRLATEVQSIEVTIDRDKNTEISIPITLKKLQLNRRNRRY